MNELIRKYLGYPELRKGQDYDWDGRDMVLAINKMWDKGDWYKFQYYCEAIYEKGSEQLAANVWLFGSPDNFFKLMEEWLNEKAD